MTPLNSEERRSSLFLFLIFFIISVALVAVTVFYGMEVPTIQNKLMNEKIEAFQKDQAFLEMFATKIAKVSGDLENINKPNVDADGMDFIIKATLDTLQLQVGADTSIRSEMYKNVIQNLKSFQTAKQQLRDFNNSNKSMAALQQQLSEAQKNLTDCQFQVASFTNQKK